MISKLTNVVGSRGEKIAELCLTDFSAFDEPLFQPGFLGDKWPTIDFYVELMGVTGRRPFFLGQVKTTLAEILPSSQYLSVTTEKKDIEGLLDIPGPTYILGVHEPSKRVFVRSVHKGIVARAMTRIPLSYELTTENLMKLHDEVREYWSNDVYKPTQSEFA